MLPELLPRRLRAALTSLNWHLLSRVVVKADV